MAASNAAEARGAVRGMRWVDGDVDVATDRVVARAARRARGESGTTSKRCGVVVCVRHAIHGLGRVERCAVVAVAARRRRGRRAGGTRAGGRAADAAPTRGWRPGTWPRTDRGRWRRVERCTR